MYAGHNFAKAARQKAARWPQGMIERRMTDATMTHTAGGPSAGQRPWRASFEAARRHSARVRLLKRAIPLGSGLAVISVVLIGIFDPFRSIGAVSIGPVNLSGTRITMDQPRLTGFRVKDAKPYEVSAESATQDIRRPTVVEMKKLVARVELENQESVRLVADTGIYDTSKEQIELNDNVRVQSARGYDARLATAFVDFKAGSVRSDRPVEVRFTDGSVRSDRLHITDGGKRLAFEGRVKAVFDAPDNAGQPRPRNPATTPASPSGQTAP